MSLNGALRLRSATLRTNGCEIPFPFVLSVAERKRSEVEGRHFS